MFFFSVCWLLLSQLALGEMQVNRYIQQIANLHQLLNQKTQQINCLRASLHRQVEQKVRIQENLQSVQNDNTRLEGEVDFHRTQCDDLKREICKFKPSSHYKTYNNLQSKSGKLERKRECKKIFQNLLSHMTDVSTAKVTLTLGADKVDFVWSQNQLNVPRPQATSDDDDEEVEISEKEIFDTDGNYRKSYLRSIIYVMDKHKISHEAYHETRMVTNGYMPPIHIIKREKKDMSEEIEYIKHPTVCKLLIFTGHGRLIETQLI